MIIRSKCAGVLPEYHLDGTVLTLQDALTLDLDGLVQDEPTHIVISEDKNGALVLGANRRYVAELDLPARRYSIEKIGFVDDFGYPALRRTALPCTVEDVVLTLWGRRERCK